MGWQSALDEWIEKPHTLGHLLGFEKLSDVHSEWVNLFLRCPPSGETVLQAHRNSYKTTSGLVALTLLFMLYPNIRVLIVRKTLTNAEKLLMAMQQIFESALFRAWVMDRHGIDDVKTDVWSRSQCNLAFKTTVTAEPSLQATGVGNSLTGAHFDFIWADDIVTDLDRWSLAERESTKNYVYELSNIIEPLGSRVYTGTTWHPDDAFSVLPEAHKYPIGTINIVGIDAAWIAEKKRTMPNSLWCANYELTHVFEDDIIGAFEIVPKFSTPYLVAFIDTSFSDADKSDRTALTIVGYVPQAKWTDDYWPIEFTGMAWQKSVTHQEVMADVIRILDKYQPIESHLESQLSDSTVAFIERLQAMEDAMGIKTKNNWTWAHQSKNKHERIMMNVHSNRHRIKVLADTDQAYLKRIVNYTKKDKNEDEIDSLAGGIILWRDSKSLRNYIYAVKQAEKMGIKLGV